MPNLLNQNLLVHLFSRSQHGLHVRIIWRVFLKCWFWDFPGGPVVKTPCFHCRGHGFNPLFRELRSHMRCGQKLFFFFKCWFWRLRVMWHPSLSSSLLPSLPSFFLAALVCKFLSAQLDWGPEAVFLSPGCTSGSPESLTTGPCQGPSLRTNWMRISRGWNQEISISQSSPDNSRVHPGILSESTGYHILPPDIQFRVWDEG